jgi:cell division protein FtsQ
MANRRMGANRHKRIAERSRKRRSNAKHAGRRIVLAIAAIAAVAAAIVAGSSGLSKASHWVRTTSLFQVRDVRVAGALNASQDAVLKAAGITGGMFLGDVKPEKIIAEVQKLPWVQKVMVKRNLFGRVSLVLSERKPIAIVNLGGVFQIDRDGVVLELPASSAVALPVVSGLGDTVIDGVRRITPAGMRRFLSFWDDAQAGSADLFRQIAEVDFSRQDRIRFSLDGNPAIIEFDNNGVSTRMAQLSLLTRSLPQGKPAIRIDLRYANLAYVVQPADSSRRSQ